MPRFLWLRPSTYLPFWASANVQAGDALNSTYEPLFLSISIARVSSLTAAMSSVSLTGQTVVGGRNSLGSLPAGEALIDRPGCR